VIEETPDNMPSHEQRWEDHGQQQLSGEEARQAKPLGHMRYVLGISLTLIIAAFAILYFGFQ
jgi:hypothetical protein